MLSNVHVLLKRHASGETSVLPLKSQVFGLEMRLWRGGKNGETMGNEAG